MLKRIYYWFIETILDKHVCKEFTQWTTRCEKFSRPPYNHFERETALKTDTGKIIFTKRWQERQCTICGKMEQRDLDN